MDAVSHSLASKLDRLFSVMHKASEPPISTQAAAAAITADHGVSMTTGALDALLDGRRTDPDHTELSAIAAFFGVTPEYLLTDGPVPRIESQLSLLEMLRDASSEVISVHVCHRSWPMTTPEERPQISYR